MLLKINELQYIINESYKMLLTELSNDAIESMFKRLLPEYVPLLNKPLNELVTYIKKLSISESDFNNYGHYKLKDWMRLRLLKDFNTRNQSANKMLRGIIRISCGNEINRFNSMTEEQSKKYKAFTVLIANLLKHGIVLNEDLNGMSFGELMRKYGVYGKIDSFKSWKLKTSSNGDENKSQYRVIPIHSYEEARTYYNYCAWCVVQDSSYFEDYTTDGSQFFFCLKDGYQDILKKVGPFCPLDEYGLSMVAVLIFPNGNVKSITTRWNHEYGGENHNRLHTLEQVEQVMGIPKSYFIPQIDKPKFSIDDIEHLLKNTDIDVEDIFSHITDLGNGYQVVQAYDERDHVRSTILKGRELILPEWYYLHIANRDGSVWFKPDSFSCILWDSERGFVTNGTIDCVRFPKPLDKSGNYYAVEYDFDEFEIIDKDCKFSYPINYDKDDIPTDILAVEGSNYCVVKHSSKIEILDTSNKLKVVWVGDGKTYSWVDPTSYSEDTVIIRKTIEGSINKRNYNYVFLDLRNKSILGNDIDIVEAKPFNGNKALVKIGDINTYMWNCLKRDGTLMFDGEKTYVWEMYDNGYMQIGLERNYSVKYAIAKPNGSYVKSCLFDEIDEFDGYSGVAIDNDIFWVIDQNGNPIRKIDPNNENWYCLGKEGVLIIYKNSLCNIIGGESDYGQGKFNEWLRCRRDGYIFYAVDEYNNVTYKIDIMRKTITEVPNEN